MDELPAAARDVARRVASGAPAGDWAAPETLLAMLFAVDRDPSELRGTQVRADGTERQHPAVVAIAAAIVDLVASRPDPTYDAIRRAIEGKLCGRPRRRRCGNIVTSIRRAAGDLLAGATEAVR